MHFWKERSPILLAFQERARSKYKMEKQKEENVMALRSP
jgi:hypothetical protein